MPFAGFNVIDASFSKSNQMIVVRKLPARYAPIVMPFVLSILMTAVVSVISTRRIVTLVVAAPPQPGR